MGLVCGLDRFRNISNSLLMSDSATQAPSRARERVLQAALDCFTEKGYAATTIADIEVAAGLKPRCGGTYRHFPSKKAILEAAVDRLLDDGDVVLSPEHRSAKEAAAAGLALLDRNRGTRRLLFRDLDDFPELQAKVADRLIERAFRTAAESAAVFAPEADTEAMAAVMVAALTGFRTVHEIIGHPPLGVSDERFIDAWASAFEGLIVNALDQTPAEP